MTGRANYLVINPSIFDRLSQQTMLLWKFNLGQYDLTKADSKFFPILTSGRPGPPEIIGGHEPSGYYAMGFKRYGAGKNVIVTGNLGKLYYLHGYQQHKNILLDVIDHIYPQVGDLLRTDAPARVEVIPQYYIKNIPSNINRTRAEGMLLHLVNLTGFSGNTYLTLTITRFPQVRPVQAYQHFTLTDNLPIPFT